MQFLGCQQRKTFLKVEAHLITEYAACAGSRAVGFIDAGFHDMTE
jgi:hypothetical protein